MKKSRVIQFVVAALLFSCGCVALLVHAPIAIFTICFCLPSVVLLRRSEMTRPVASREFLIMIAILAALAALITCADLFIPQSAGVDFIRRPVIVVPLWVLAILGLFWRWRRERRLSDA